MQRFLLPRGYLPSLHFEFHQAFKENINSSKTLQKVEKRMTLLSSFYAVKSYLHIEM
jgi:hypothetical protein